MPEGIPRTPRSTKRYPKNEFAPQPFASKGGRAVIDLIARRFNAGGSFMWVILAVVSVAVARMVMYTMLSNRQQRPLKETDDTKLLFV